MCVLYTFDFLSTLVFVLLFETMSNTPLNTNQVIPMLETILLTGNVGVPLMATLNLPGFTLGLPVWLFFTPTVLNAPDASQVSSLYQGHQNTASPSLVVDSPPSTSCDESTDTSNRQSKRSKRSRNWKKAHKKGGTYSTSVSQVEPHHPASVVHAGGTHPTSVGHVGFEHSTSASQVDLHHPASIFHAGGTDPTSTNHVGSKHSPSAS